MEAAKAQPEVKDGYMYFSDILEEEKEKAAAAGEERGFTAGEERGRSAGIAIGAEHKSLETARNMLAEGFPAEPEYAGGRVSGGTGCPADRSSPGTGAGAGRSRGLLTGAPADTGMGLPATPVTVRRVYAGAGGIGGGGEGAV